MASANLRESDTVTSESISAIRVPVDRFRHAYSRRLSEPPVTVRSPCRVTHDTSSDFSFRRCTIQTMAATTTITARPYFSMCSTRPSTASMAFPK